MTRLIHLSTPRLEKAIERSGMKDGSLSIRDLCRTLERRGMSDRDIHSLFFKLIGALEPPACPMSHCKHHGGCGAPMNCSLERVPGHCSILKEFKQRRDAKRKAKEVAQRLDVAAI